MKKKHKKHNYKVKVFKVTARIKGKNGITYVRGYEKGKRRKKSRLLFGYK